MLDFLKPKHPKYNADRATVIHFLLDDSGSMSGWRMPTINGHNVYIDTLRGTDKEVDVTCSLTKFGSRGHYYAVYKDVRIDQVPYLTTSNYNPNSGTDINDALRKCIADTEQMLSARKDKPNVVIILQTDGEDTPNPDLIPIIMKKQKDGWIFMMMGCGNSVERYALGIGLKKENISYYAGQKTKEAFENLAQNTVRYVHSGSLEDIAYTEEQRKRQVT